DTDTGFHPGGRNKTSANIRNSGVPASQCARRIAPRTALAAAILLHAAHVAACPLLLGPPKILHRCRKDTPGKLARFNYVESGCSEGLPNRIVQMDSSLKKPHTSV